MKTDKGIEQRVHPTMVPQRFRHRAGDGRDQCVTIDAEGIAPITLVGPGAGGMATASAVVADIARHRRAACAPRRSAVPAEQAHRFSKKAPMQLPRGRAITSGCWRSISRAPWRRIAERSGSAAKSRWNPSCRRYRLRAARRRATQSPARPGVLSS